MNLLLHCYHQSILNLLECLRRDIVYHLLTLENVQMSHPEMKKYEILANQVAAISRNYNDESGKRNF